MKRYESELERSMREFYESLNEKDRRRYAGIEALKLGEGGRNYIAQILGCSRKTVSKGAKEVSHLPKREVDQRIRQPGGGRLKYTQLYEEIDEKFLKVLSEHTAGSPMEEKVRWTDLSEGEIKQALHQEYQLYVSKTVVRKLLLQHNYRRRKAQKEATMKAVPHRNEQFEKIQRIRKEYEAAGNPIISMDTKKKEQLGNFYREGHLYTLEALKTFDHDFVSFSDGVIIPHSIYDLRYNIGYLQLGNRHDTSEFACDSLRLWWQHYGCTLYPNASSLLILCDGGGSNSSRQHLFKIDLQHLADEIGIEIRIAHYPPYCSKYNPIEHRLFPHVTRACQGVIFTSISLVKQLMQKTSTAKGLKVYVHLLEKAYQTGRKASAHLIQSLSILFDPCLPQWNYRAIPRSSSIG